MLIKFGEDFPSLSSEAAEAQWEIEREEISKKFPSSITQYFPPCPGTDNFPGDFLKKAVPLDSVTSAFKTELSQVSKCRSTFDLNLNKLQLQSGQTYPLLISTADNDRTRKERIKKLVDEHIEEISAQLKESSQETNKPKKAAQKKNTTKTNQTNRQFVAGKVPLKVERDLKMDESMTTHVYGRAEYHPRRTTTSTAEQGGTSPKKKFRTKRALESVQGIRIRSAKSQTHDPPTPAFLFSPSRDVTSTVTPGNLVPVAVPLGPPMIYDSHIVPVLVPASDVKHKCPPTPKHAPAREAAERHISPSPCPAPRDVSVQVHEVGPDIVRDEPRAEIQRSSVDSVAGAEIRVEGCHEDEAGRKSPFTIPRPKKPEADDYARVVNDTAIEDQALNRIEEELMARVLSCLSRRLPHAPINDQHASEDAGGFVLVADAAAEVDDGDAEELLDSALRGVIRDMISTRTHGDPQPSRTLPTVAPPQSPPPLHYQVATPQPTPTASADVSEAPIEKPDDVRTPLFTPDVSSKASTIAEPPLVYEAEPSVASEASLHEKPETPPASISTPPPADVEYQQSEVAADVSTSIASFDDPWEGNPPSEEGRRFQPIRTKPSLKPAMVDEVSNVVLLQRAPSPAGPHLDHSSSDEPSSTEPTSSRDHDGTISDGQLIISHGQIKHLKGFQSMANRSETLTSLPELDDDDQDMEPISEGQVHVVKRVPPAEREDPGGVFARPRRGAEDDVSEDKSIGEIVSSGSNRRERFRKWKERRIEELASQSRDKSFDDVKPTAARVVVVKPAASSLVEYVDDDQPVPEPSDQSTADDDL